MDPVRAHLRTLLTQRIRAVLAPRERQVVDLGDALREGRALLEQVEDGIHRLETNLSSLGDELDFWQRPFAATMTIDQALRRHGGAPAVFARYHLPACHHCAVRFDETLEEAAQAYGLKLPALLDDLNGLVPLSDLSGDIDAGHPVSDP